jgi:neural Wiskott-Aldrich syndrome protein
VARTPTAGSGSLMRRLEVPSLPAWLPAPPPWLPAPPPRPPAPWTRANGLQAVPPPQVAPGGRMKRGDAGCAAPTGHLFRTPQIHQRTAGGAEEADPQAHGAQRRVSPPPPPPSGSPPPQPPPPPSVLPPPPPPGGDLPKGTTSSSKSSSRPASRVAGKSRALSECSPFFH